MSSHMLRWVEFKGSYRYFDFYHYRVLHVAWRLMSPRIGSLNASYKRADLGHHVDPTRLGGWYFPEAPYRRNSPSLCAVLNKTRAKCFQKNSDLRRQDSRAFLFSSNSGETYHNGVLNRFGKFSYKTACHICFTSDIHFTHIFITSSNTLFYYPQSALPSTHCFARLQRTADITVGFLMPGMGSLAWHTYTHTHTNSHLSVWVLEAHFP